MSAGEQTKKFRQKAFVEPESFSPAVRRDRIREIVPMIEMKMSFVNFIPKVVDALSLLIGPLTIFQGR